MASTPQSPKKRPIADTLSSGRERKRIKFRDARTIATESGSPALKDGLLDLHKFAESRKFEIEALQDAMERSRNSANQRAFQGLPRDMRRRAANHNPKRVPKRLRDQSKLETADIPPKQRAQGKKRLKAQIQKRASVKLRDHKSPRQEDEIQTEDDHLFKHRKIQKAKFTKRQLHKAWLPTHLYHSKRAHMKVKWGFSIPETPTDKSYRPSHRAFWKKGCIAWDTSYFGCIIMSGEVQLLSGLLEKFCEPGCGVGAPRYIGGKRCLETYAYRRGEFPKGLICPATIVWAEDSRKVLIRVHPAVYADVYKLFKSAAEGADGIELEDCRYDIAGFEIVGTESWTALNSIFILADEENSKIWQNLQGISDTGMLPIGAVLPLTIYDPRFSVPKKPKDSLQTPDLSATLKEWPRGINFRAGIFDSVKRDSSTSLKPPQSEIDSRRRVIEMSTPISPLPTDPQIPLLLLRQSTSSWTILVPWDWLTILWHQLQSLPFIRFGGQKQFEQFNFESKVAFFPRDYPGTKAGDLEEIERSKEVCTKWTRRPASKRIKFEKVCAGKGETGNSFGCDWEYLIHGKKGDERKIYGEGAMTTDENVPTTTMPTESTVWLLTTCIARQVFSGSIGKIPVDLDSAVFGVVVTITGRGIPTANSRIYGISKDEVDLWKNCPPAGSSNYPVCPEPEDLIGFITTGSFNLREGGSTGVGALSIKKALKWQGERFCIVRECGQSLGRLAKWDFLAH
ncbi:Ribonucleases P/MRP protein subunit pop1 [Neolecta irregularis DAH-3]|uniref:Ribonucleases P/MRP protein subunit pop1 n=1 Tax=Neolecta irregularis (strain DAH-3) TaxID=1198029 RepID=A0A1U7LVI8_NEOID|nr:Ribonucleases P/MRP protein subunit pop1 [Neolecta irregularis DAH-3]|eukprot:OLL26690.1 Ribonucleases P/MRP protein subunit pop1 [Neolecta irregularis DAH-3]